MFPDGTTAPVTPVEPAVNGPSLGACPSCGITRAVGGEVASVHRTSEGLVIWVRCVCGALELRRQAAGATEVLGRGRSPRPPKAVARRWP
jgi:hypothetical protein